MIIILRQNSTESVGNMPPFPPGHLLPQVFQMMHRKLKYDQFESKGGGGQHNEETPQSTTKMPGNPKFDPFY